MKIKKLITTLLLVFALALCASAEEAEGFVVKLAFGDGETEALETAVVDREGAAQMLVDWGLAEYYEPNYKAELLVDADYKWYWGIDMMGVKDAAALGCYGNDIRIGVLDTGVYNHPNMINNIVPGWNYITDTADTNDTAGHGTFISGIIAAEGNTLAITGLASRAKIVPLKCMEASGGTLLDTVDAIKGAVDDFDCRIINMSFAFHDNPKLLQDAVDYAAAKGVILIAAAGNDGTSQVVYPAGYDNVIGVGAIDSTKTVWEDSQKNESVFVVAPGVDVASLTFTQSGWGITSGTSCSAPFVAALCANAMCVDENLTLEEFKALLIASAEDLGVGGYDTSYGYGLVSSGALLREMLKDTPYFVSPILRADGENAATIFNNTATELNAITIWKNSENQIAGSAFSLPAGEKAKTTAPDGEHFLWKDFDSLMPLARVRRQGAER